MQSRVSVRPVSYTHLMNLNPITMQLVADKYIRLALEEDINGEDVTTCSVTVSYTHLDWQPCD